MEQGELKLELKTEDQERYEVEQSGRRNLLNQYLRFAKMEKKAKLEASREMYRKQKDILIKQMTQGSWCR